MAPLQVKAQKIEYPKAPSDKTIETYFGVEVADPFRPLEDDNSAETLEWVKEENTLTRSYLDTLPQRAPYYSRLKEVATFATVSAPFERHGKWYQYRNDGTQNQNVLYRMESINDEGSVFLDPNSLSTNGTVALQGISFSNDGKYFAYVISRNGSDWQEIFVMDVATGELLEDHIVWSKFSGATWYKDGFFYSAYDAPEAGHETSAKNTGQKIYYHKIGTPQSEDTLFYQNPKYPLRFYRVTVNKEESVMLLYEDGMAEGGNNLYIRDPNDVSSEFVQITHDPTKEYNVVSVLDDTLYVSTNYGAPKNRIMCFSTLSPDIKDWKEVVPEREDALTEVCFVGGDKMILNYLRDNCNVAFLYNIKGEKIADIELPGIGSASFSGKRERPECFLSYTSYTVPTTIYMYDVESGKSTLYSKPTINCDTESFTSEMHFYTSKDGTRIPLFLTFKKGMKKRGNNPVLMYGYGGFNVTYTPSFSYTMIPFLESGGIYAYVVLRGGGEYGEGWHLAGTRTQKQNVFDDFISAAKWLIAEGYTDSEHLAIMGGSNGGLLVGACMTQRPDLFKVCIPRVGVMDMLRYHKFTIGWNWAHDYGTSDDSKEMFEYLKGYSPLHNLREGVSYPATLVTTADHDDRVVPAHSFKFAATLQACQGGSAPVLIRIDSDAGHGGGKPLSKVLEEYADIYAFIMHGIGMTISE